MRSHYVGALLEEEDVEATRRRRLDRRAARGVCQMPAGTYYLSSNTIDCTWVVTVSEMR